MIRRLFCQSRDAIEPDELRGISVQEGVRNLSINPASNQPSKPPSVLDQNQNSLSKNNSQQFQDNFDNISGGVPIINLTAVHAGIFIELSPIPMAIISKVGAIKYINDAFKETIVSPCADMVSLLNPEDALGFTTLLNKVVRKSINELVASYMTITELGCPPKACIWTLRLDPTASYLLLTLQSQPTFSLESEAVRSLETRRVFVRHVSHEIRTPLNVVMSGLELLATLVEDVKSEVHETIADLDVSTCDIVDLACRVHKTFLLPSRHSGIQLDFDNDTDRDLVLVDADPTKLSQVMRNLVSNAMKFTPAGGSCRLMLTLNKRLERVRLEVHDSGPGMTREQRARLFKEMVQFNARELQGGQGSGMGLFLSRRIIELHGGLIGVDMDREQPGSMFYIELPISANEESNPQARLSRNISSAGMIKINPGDKSLRLLLVDDSAMTRKVCIRLMTSLGVECEEAANGEDAVAQVRASLQTATPYDGVLMDWEMPQMCGLQATRIIRDLGYTGKIFGVTGNAYKADILRFLQHGADEVFAKPLTLDKYAHIIEKIR